MKRMLPLIIFLALALLLGYGLKNADQKTLIPSPLINKPAPEFNLPLVGKPDTLVSRADLLGKTYLLNVWASWCVSCRMEHPFVIQLAKSGLLEVYGLNWKDETEDALTWLQQHGNPYAINLADMTGRTAIDFGVYGAPESFIVDYKGNIRYKHVGILDSEILEQEIKPILNEISEEKQNET